VTANKAKPCTLHELRCWPEPFEHIRRELKRFEYRRDDRGFQVGDGLRLREWSPDSQAYTGDEARALVTYVLRGNVFGVPEGFCVMSIVLVDVERV
jgi:ParB family chromosome partitioning protein